MIAKYIIPGFFAVAIASSAVAIVMSFMATNDLTPYPAGSVSDYEIMGEFDEPSLSPANIRQTKMAADLKKLFEDQRKNRAVNPPKPISNRAGVSKQRADWVTRCTAQVLRKYPDPLPYHLIDPAFDEIERKCA